MFNLTRKEREKVVIILEEYFKNNKWDIKIKDSIRKLKKVNKR